MADTKSKLHVAPDPEPAVEGEEVSIAKPSDPIDLNKFASKRSAAVAGRRLRGFFLTSSGL